MASLRELAIIAFKKGLIDEHEMWELAERAPTLADVREIGATLQDVVGPERKRELETLVADPSYADLQVPMPRSGLGPRFEIRDALGSGAVGRVIAVWDKEARRLVAVKRLKRADAGSEQTKRFLAEARLTAQLELYWARARRRGEWSDCLTALLRAPRRRARPRKVWGHPERDRSPFARHTAWGRRHRAAALRGEGPNRRPRRAAPAGYRSSQRRRASAG
jgi:hypothetical protein